MSDKLFSPIKFASYKRWRRNNPSKFKSSSLTFHSKFDWEKEIKDYNSQRQERLKRIKRLFS